MSAHDRSGASVESYLCRLVAALCKKNGGELRVRGADVDRITEPAVLIKDWDDEKQEVVIRLGSAFNEVYRVNPSQPKAATLWKQPEEAPEATTTGTVKAKKTSTLEDNERLTELDNNLKRHRIARAIKEEMAEKVRQGNLQL